MKRSPGPGPQVDVGPLTYSGALTYSEHFSFKSEKGLNKEHSLRSFISVAYGNEGLEVIGGRSS